MCSAHALQPNFSSRRRVLNSFVGLVDVLAEFIDGKMWLHAHNSGSLAGLESQAHRRHSYGSRRSTSISGCLSKDHEIFAGLEGGTVVPVAHRMSPVLSSGFPHIYPYSKKLSEFIVYRRILQIKLLETTSYKSIS